LRKNKDIFFAFVNPNSRWWIFLSTKKILILVSGSKCRQYKPIPNTCLVSVGQQVKSSPECPVNEERVELGPGSKKSLFCEPCYRSCNGPPPLFFLATPGLELITHPHKPT
jgi:hypothetical protein